MKVLFGVLLIPYSVLLRGFVFMKVYNWHLYEFAGTGVIGFIESCVAMSLFGFIFAQMPVKEVENRPLGVTVAFSTVIALITLLTGFIFTIF